MSILRGRLRGYRWIAGSGNHSYWLGIYEPHIQQRIVNDLPPGGVFFDIGSQAGYYALLAAVCVTPGGRVYAFEPLPENAAYLRQHLQLNHIANAKVFEVAVSDRAGTATFDLGANRFMGNLSAEGALQVRTVSLDGLLAQGVIILPTCIKIDVEGAELQVLEGGRALLVQAHPTIYLSTHRADIHQKCCALLSELGYQLESLDDRDVAGTDQILARFSGDPQARARG
jgi:FkbM family methyltransferase